MIDRFIQALAEIILGYLSDRRAEQHLKNLGYSQAQLDAARAARQSLEAQDEAASQINSASDASDWMRRASGYDE